MLEMMSSVIPDVTEFGFHFQIWLWYYGTKMAKVCLLILG